MKLLSSIENDTFQPQLGTVMRLAKALDSAFGRLVGGAGDKPYSITRPNEQKLISGSVSRNRKKTIHTYMSLAPEVEGRHMEALLVQLEENPDDEMSVHEGEEFLYVLEGVATIRLGDDRFELKAGDDGIVYDLAVFTMVDGKIVVMREVASIEGFGDSLKIGS